MDASFWHQKWADNKIGFHNSDVNSLLVKYIGALALKEGDRVFVPLCGKTLDIGWLLAQGFRVAGAELSEVAIEQLFAELGLTPEKVNEGEVVHYSAENLDIYVGNIFDLSDEMLGDVDAVYDRAALVALPEQMRDRYTAHLLEITNKAPQLLICFEYDQSLMAGPPHAISRSEVHRHYEDSYALELAESKTIKGGLKGQCPATKNVWLLRNR